LHATIFSCLLLLVEIFFTWYPLSIFPTLFTKKSFDYIISLKCCSLINKFANSNISTYEIFIAYISWDGFFAFFACGDFSHLVYIFHGLSLSLWWKKKSIILLFLQVVLWLTILAIQTYLFLIANEFINVNEKRRIQRDVTQCHDFNMGAWPPFRKDKKNVLGMKEVECF
jgi:hypothetical protein